MDLTILQAMLGFLGPSIASDITWNLIKELGKKLIKTFNTNFKRSGAFNSNIQAERFLKTIATESTGQYIEPGEGIKQAYVKATGQEPSDEFLRELQRWFHAEGDSFTRLHNNNSTETMSVELSDITASGNSSVNININYKK